MNRTTVNIIFILLLLASVVVTKQAITFAGDAAFSGKQPNLWLAAGAFFISILLVLIAIILKIKNTAS